MLQRVIPLLLVVLMAGCAQTRVQDDSLYLALGGRAGIDRLTYALLEQIADDPRIVGFFAESDISRVQHMLAEHLCELSGGPCDYDQDTMVRVHQGMHISEAQFNAMVEDLIDAMESLGLSTPTQNRLLARLAPLRRDIINL